MDKQEVLDRCRRDNVAFVRLQFTEPYGAVKNVSIPFEELEKALDNELMFDGSSIRGFKRIEQSDMYFLPDPATYALLPWRGTEESRTARLICDVADPDGQPFAGDPRTNLKRVLAEADDLGYTMQVGPEAEFFLFRTDEEGNPTVDPHDAATYFDVAPIDRGEDCRRDIELTLQKMGFHLEAAHHEVAIGQHEIDFRHADALTTADNLITFRMVVKTIAAANNMHATFMAKPIHGENGSGMHINQSLSRGPGERVPGRLRRAQAVGRVPLLHRRHPAPPAGHHGGRQPDREQLQAAAAGLRGAGLHRLVAGQPLGRHPRAGQARPLDPDRAAHAGPDRQPLPGAGLHAAGRAWPGSARG